MMEILMPKNNYLDITFMHWVILFTQGVRLTTTGPGKETDPDQVTLVKNYINILESIYCQAGIQ